MSVICMREGTKTLGQGADKRRRRHQKPDNETDKEHKN